MDEIDRKNLNIKVLNGSGLIGAAGRAVEKLKKEGFETLSSANADSFNYEQTLIQYKKGREKEAEFLNKLFDNAAELVETNNRQEDIILIIGKNLSI